MSAVRLAPARRRKEAVVCFGYGVATRRRQPWHAARHLAMALQADGAEVVLLTDGTEAVSDEPFRVEALGPLKFRGKPAPALCSALEQSDCARAWIVIGAHELIAARHLDLGLPATLVVASPRFTLRELARLGPRALWAERHLLGLVVLDAVLPSFVLRRGWRRSGADSAVYLSPSAQHRWAAAGLPAGRVMRPRVAAAWRSAPRTEDAPIVGYLGPALAIRGADLSVEAFERACERGLEARLELLLRPDAGPAATARLLDRIRRSPWAPRIDADVAMLDEATLRARASRWACFLLPFRVTVSDAPLVVVEAGLTGRPVVVLDTPGVAEFARALGGIVARTTDELVDGLLYAARAPERSPPDPGQWTGRTPVPAPLPRPALALLALCGVDGVGKTALAERIGAAMTADGVLVRRFWSRFRNYASKPLLALARLTGHNRKERRGGVVTGYHDFAGHAWLAVPFLVLQTIDLALDLVLRCRIRRRGASLVADRCVLDGLVDLAVDTGFEALVIDRIAPRLARLLPKPWVAVVIERDAAAIGRDRPDALHDANHALRRRLYRRLAYRLQLPVLANDGPLDEIAAAVRGIAAEARPAEVGPGGAGPAGDGP